MPTKRGLETKSDLIAKLNKMNITKGLTGLNKDELKNKINLAIDTLNKKELIDYIKSENTKEEKQAKKLTISQLREFIKSGEVPEKVKRVYKPRQPKVVNNFNNDEVYTKIVDKVNTETKTTLDTVPVTKSKAELEKFAIDNKLYTKEEIKAEKMKKPELIQNIINKIDAVYKFDKQNKKFISDLTMKDKTAKDKQFGKTYTFTFNDDVYTTEALKVLYAQAVTNIIKYETLDKSIKFQISAKVQYSKNDETAEQYLTTKNEIVNRNQSKQEITDKLNQLFEVINTESDTTTQTKMVGSGWVIDSVLSFSVIIYTFKPKLLSGGEYFDTKLAGFKGLKGNNALLNVQNTDNLCFLYCIAAKQHPVESIKRPERPTHYEDYIEKYNIENIKFPLSINDVKKFENQNKGIYINIFTYSKSGEMASLIVNKEHVDDAIDLLFIEHEDKAHYILIREFSSFKAAQTKNVYNKTYMCKLCLSFEHRDEQKYKEHIEDCKRNDPVKTILPQPNTFKEFKNYKYKIKNPFVVYCDFESSLCKVSDDDQHAKKGAYAIHKANSYAFKTVCAYDSEQDNFIIKNNFENSQQLVSDFIKDITNEAIRVHDLKKEIKPMNLTEQEEKDFKKTDTCHICNQKIEPSDKVYKVRDHCHFTGQFRGAAHNGCNINYKNSLNLNVFIHNLSGYDSHLFIGEIGNFITQSPNSNLSISCIPNTEEKYISFSLKGTINNKFISIRFIDSYKILSESIDNLAKSMKKDDYKQIKEYFNIKDTKDEKFEILTKKGIYPYEYIDDDAQTKMQQNQLPEMHHFHSRFNGYYDNNDNLIKQKISEEDYEHAKTVWKTMNCKTLLDYHNLYLTLDVLLLTDIIETSRDLMFDTYGLDISHYLTLPAFADDCLYKLTSAKIELISDMEKYLMIEKGMFGGISFISNRYAKSDIQDMSSIKTGEDEKNTFIRYYDANNLYGYAMSQPMPIGKHQFDTNTDKYTTDYIMSLNQDINDKYFQEYDEFTKPDEKTNVGKSVFTDEDGYNKFVKTGYLFEVDLEYPHELHDLHNDYPLCPEHLITTKDQYSEYQNIIAEKLNISVSTVPKLCTTLNNKSKYIIILQNLQQCLTLGMKLTKVHRVLTFHQVPFMRPYIQKNTKLRSLSTTDFEKDFYKLMNNAVFGKSMENVRNRIDFNLVSDDEQAKKLIAKPFFKSTVEFNKNLHGFHMHKQNLTLNKPIFIGQAILSLSKNLMYDFHYNFIKTNFPTAKLLFTDTDSLCYVFNENFNKFNNTIKNNIHLFDNASYPKDHPLYNSKNKKIQGKFKDEMNSIEIVEFVAQRSKLYAYKTLDKDIFNCKDITEDVEKKINIQKITCKGVKKCVKNKLTVDDFRNSLFNQVNKNVKIQLFGTANHNIYTYEQEKTCLCAFDDKRYILNDGITTHAFGHFRISELKN